MAPRSRDDITSCRRAARANGGNLFGFREQMLPQALDLELGVNIPDWQRWLLPAPSEGADQ